MHSNYYGFFKQTQLPSNTTSSSTSGINNHQTASILSPSLLTNSPNQEISSNYPLYSSEAIISLSNRSDSIHNISSSCAQQQQPLAPCQQVNTSKSWINKQEKTDEVLVANSDWVLNNISKVVSNAKTNLAALNTKNHHGDDNEDYNEKLDGLFRVNSGSNPIISNSLKQQMSFAQNPNLNLCNQADTESSISMSKSTSINSPIVNYPNKTNLNKNGPKELDYLLAANAAAALVSQLSANNSNTDSSNEIHSSNLVIEQLKNQNKNIQSTNENMGNLNSSNFYNNNNQLEQQRPPLPPPPHITPQQQQHQQQFYNENFFNNKNFDVASQLKSYSSNILNPFNHSNLVQSMVNTNSFINRVNQHSQDTTNQSMINSNFQHSFNPTNLIQENSLGMTTSSSYQSIISNQPLMFNSSNQQPNSPQLNTNQIYDQSFTNLTQNLPYSTNLNHLNQQHNQQQQINLDYQNLLNNCQFGPGINAFKNLNNFDLNSNYSTSGGGCSTNFNFGRLENGGSNKPNANENLDLLNEHLMIHPNEHHSNDNNGGPNSNDPNMMVYPWMNPKGSGKFIEILLFFV